MATPWKSKRVHDRIWRERGRRPCTPTAKVTYQEIKTKSKAGVEYTHYRPMLMVRKAA